MLDRASFVEKGVVECVQFEDILGTAFSDDTWRELSRALPPEVRIV